MRRSDFQRELQRNKANGFYPTELRAACQRNRDRVSATWKRLPPGSAFATHMRLSKDAYERRHSDLQSKGYERVWMNEYVDCQGERWFQATWLQPRAARVTNPAPVDAHWMTSSEFRQEFERRVLDGLHPGEVYGECYGGAERFRASWTSTPSGATALAFVSMSEALYKGRDADFRAKGYSRAWVGEFKDCAGGRKYQATWLKLAR